MLANQEALVKHIAGVSLKQEEEALFSSRRTGRPDRKSRGGARNQRSTNRQPKEGTNECYNCENKGHYARDCWSKKKGQGNVATSRKRHDEKSQECSSSEDDWDVEAACAVVTTKEEKEREKKSEVALNTVSKSERINYKSDWIIDSGCSNHMTDDIKKLDGLEKYKGRQVIVTANNSKLPITYIGKTTISPRFGLDLLELQRVYHVPGMKKNMLSVSQLTAQGNYVVFGPHEVKVYRNLKATGTPMMEDWKMESIYVMSAESAYIDKTRRNETPDLWHTRLGT